MPFGSRTDAISGPHLGRPSWQDIWHEPMPHLTSPLHRGIVRTVAGYGRRQLVGIRGLEHVAVENDPFLFVVNHNQRLETVLLPSLLALRRRGKMVHFLADWPMKLLPPVALMYRCNQVITVTSKSARPRWLNLFRPLFQEKVPAFERALQALAHGASVGIFPEGTMNRHPTRLLRGQTGAARLALASGVPIVPAGIRFPDNQGNRISDLSRLEVEIGPPITLPEATEVSEKRAIVETHQRIMRELSQLSGKSWDPKAKRRRMHVPHRSAQG